MKIREVRHEDGRREIVAREDAPAEGYYASEKSIVWLRDISALPWVRERKVRGCRHRGGRIDAIQHGEIVGYAKLRKDTPPDPESGLFVRRVFFLRDSDQAALESDVLPLSRSSKLVYPQTVLPRVRSRSLKAEHGAATGQHQQPPQDKADAFADDDVLKWMDEAGGPSSAEQQPAGRPAAFSLAGEMLGSLVPVDGGPPISLDRREMTIGRLEECDIRLQSPGVSAIHCRLFVDNGYWFVEDQNSTNGVKVNGVAVPPDAPRRVDSKAVISIGKLQFQLRYSPRDIGATGLPPADVRSASAMAQSLLERANSRWPKQK